MGPAKAAFEGSASLRDPSDLQKQNTETNK